MPARTAASDTGKRLRMASSASRRATSARKVLTDTGGACQGGGHWAAQKSAIRRASMRSVLLRTRPAPPKALIWAGLTTLTVCPASARNSATASQ